MTTLIVFLSSFVLASHRLVQVSDTTVVCSALEHTLCNTSCKFENEYIPCECRQSPWTCKVYLISRYDYGEYIQGSGYADCYLGDELDCSVFVQDTRYAADNGHLELGLCTPKTCAHGVSRGVLMGFGVGAAGLCVIATGIAIWWFVVRGSPVSAGPRAGDAPPPGSSDSEELPDCGECEDGDEWPEM